MTCPNPSPLTLDPDTSIDAAVTAFVDHILENWYYYNHKSPNLFEEPPPRETLRAWVRTFLPSRGKPRLLAKPRIRKPDEAAAVYGMRDMPEKSKPYWAMHSLRTAVAWEGGFTRYSTAGAGSLWSVMDARMMAGEANFLHQTFAILFCLAIGRSRKHSASRRWAEVLGTFEANADHPDLKDVPLLPEEA